MDPVDQVAKADRIARKRPILFAIAGGLFALLQPLNPYFTRLSDPALGWRKYGWLVNAILLLMILAFGTGLMNNSRVRQLVNDEVSRQNSRSAITVGFWVMMLAAIAIYMVPALTVYDARQTVFIIVSSGTAVAMLLFAWLEHRANRNA
jgi:MFS family permease